MLMTMPTEEMIAEWKRISEEYKDRLKPNRRTAAEIVAYPERKYPAVCFTDKGFLDASWKEMLENKPFAEKLKDGERPDMVGFTVLNEGNGRGLYDKQNALFKGMDINVYIDMTTGYFHIEGSDILCDELFEYRGLDEKDLDNYFLTAEYVTQQKKLGKL